MESPIRRYLNDGNGFLIGNAIAKRRLDTRLKTVITTPYIFLGKPLQKGAIPVTLMSMTAFGAGESNTENFSYRCEIKTLNSRFIDINIRMPRSLSALESTIIAEVKKRLKRGKVDISFDLTPIDGAAKLPKLNEAAVAHYAAIEKKVC